MNTRNYYLNSNDLHVYLQPYHLHYCATISMLAHLQTIQALSKARSVIIILQTFKSIEYAH